MKIEKKKLKNFFFCDSMFSNQPNRAKYLEKDFNDEVWISEKD